MSSAEARTRLAAQQAELVRALLRKGEMPEGFVAERLRATTESLARKRCMEAAQVWPCLARALGEHFREHFEAFAIEALLPQHGGPLADGRAFVRYLAARGALPGAGRLEAIQVDLHYISTADGLKRRRGPVLRLAYLRQPRRLVLALRCPGLGERWLFLPLTLF